MATQQLSREDLQSEDFAATRAFLARFGVAPKWDGQYAEDEVLAAIRYQGGWEPSINEEPNPPSWKAEIREWRTLTQTHAAVVRDSDRMMALLRALRLALSWPTPEEEARAFNEQAQALLNMSGTEFLEKWQANELSADNPRVVHLLIARPLGW